MPKDQMDQWEQDNSDAILGNTIEPDPEPEEDKKEEDKQVEE